MDEISPKDQAKDLLRERKRAFEEVFGKATPEAKQVLKDLAKFCHADKTTYKTDGRDASRLDGRREVWMRIQKYLNTDLQELWREKGVD